MVDKQNKAKRPNKSINTKFEFVIKTLQKCDFPVAGFDILEDRITIHSALGQSFEFKDEQQQEDEMIDAILQGKLQ